MKAMLKVRALTVATAIAGVACATSSPPRASAPERTSQVSSQAPNSPTTVNESTPGTIPAGQEIDVRLRNTLSSETATVEQRFETTTVVDLVQNGRVLVPAGSVVQGVVSDVDKAGRIDRDGALTLTFDRMNVNGRNRDIRGSATQIYESKGIREEGTVAAARCRRRRHRRRHHRRRQGRGPRRSHWRGRRDCGDRRQGHHTAGRIDRTRAPGLACSSRLTAVVMTRSTV